MGLIRSTIKTLFDVPSWIGLSQIKQQTQFLVKSIKPIFSVKRRKRVIHRTFEQAMNDFDLSEKDLAVIVRRYTVFLMLYLVVTLLLVLYALYLLISRHFIPGFIVILISIIFLLKAFSMHFFCFEIKQRKLGCTLREWWSGKVEDIPS